VKDFISLADLNPDQLWRYLNKAADVKAELKNGGNKPILAGKTLGMIFQKPSLRTRVSFEVGMLQLGGHALYLSPNEIQLGSRESVPDAARVLSRYVDGIMARVFSHDDVMTLATFASIPVINGLTRRSHPCQLQVHPQHRPPHRRRHPRSLRKAGNSGRGYQFRQC